MRDSDSELNFTLETSCWGTKRNTTFYLEYLRSYTANPKEKQSVVTRKNQKNQSAAMFFFWFFYGFLWFFMDFCGCPYPSGCTFEKKERACTSAHTRKLREFHPFKGCLIKKPKILFFLIGGGHLLVLISPLMRKSMMKK